MVEQPESQSPLGVGFALASRITTVGMAFALPPAIGFAVDRWLGTTLVATLIGAGLGFVAGILQTVRMAQRLSPGPARRGVGPPGTTARTGRLDSIEPDGIQRDRHEQQPREGPDRAAAGFPPAERDDEIPPRSPGQPWPTKPRNPIP